MLLWRQGQGAGQQFERVIPRCAIDATLQVADGTRGQPGTGRQALLRESRRLAIVLEQGTKTGLLCHLWPSKVLMLRPQCTTKRCSHHSIDRLMWERCEEYVPLLRGARQKSRIYSQYELLCTEMTLPLRFIRRGA